VLDLRRLDPAGSGVERVDALSLELAAEPALQHVDHLEVDIVVMRDRDFVRTEGLGHSNDVRLNHSVGRLGDAKVTVGRICSQAVVEILIAVMACGEPLWLARLGARSGLGDDLLFCLS